MAGTWIRLAHAELSSAGDTINTGDFTPKDNLKIVANLPSDGVLDNCKLFVGTGGSIDTGSNYAFRHSTEGAGDGTNGSMSGYWFTVTNVDAGVMLTAEIINNSGREKLIQSHAVLAATGAGTAPQRAEVVGKWVNTSGQINTIRITNSGTGDFEAGSYITVWGASDDVVTDEKDALTDVEVGTRYEETDTRKIYRRASAGTFTSTDYTTSNFTAVGSTVAITSNSAVSTNTPSNTANRVYATIPSLKSTDAWSCDFQLYVTEDATNDYHTIAFCTNSDAFNTSGQNHVSVQTQGGGYQRFVLNGRIGGSNSETTTSNSTRSLNTNYYITLSSDGANTARMRIWTNSNRTGDPAQDKTLSIANIGTLTTIMHGIRNATSSPYEWSGTVSNVSLTNPAKWVERGSA